MKGPAHGAIAAGVSSTLVAGYIRKRAHEKYSPDVEPPSLSTRLRNRTPLAFAGLGFTGLSAAVAYEFDSLERQFLGDPNAEIPIHQQGGIHRNLHSIPYVGAVWGAAYLTLHSAAKFGEWVASKLQVPEVASGITEHMEELAEWIVNGSCFGVFNHILGDIPTGGHGDLALRLLTPITDRNFAQGWLKSTNPVHNVYATKAAVLVAGGAWGLSGVYLTSWKPPEKRISDYGRKLRSCESFSEAVSVVHTDISRVFGEVTGLAGEQFWNRPLFDSSFESLHPDIPVHWFHQHIDSEQVFGVERFDSEQLVEDGIWPRELSAATGGTPLTIADDDEGISVYSTVTGEDGVTVTDLVTESNEYRSLIEREGRQDGTAIRTECSDSDGTALIDDSDLESSEVSLKDASAGSTGTPLYEELERESSGTNEEGTKE